MIVNNTTTFVITSTSVSSEEMSKRLGTTASAHHGPNDVQSRIGKGTRAAPLPTRFGQWIWELKIESGENDMDGSGIASLKRMLEILSESEGTLARLRETCDMELAWVGFSTSSQGGFVIDPVVAARVGQLGLPLYCTVYTGNE